MLLGARGLALLRDVVGSGPAREMLCLLETLSSGEGEAGDVARRVGRLWSGLAREWGVDGPTPDAWRSYLILRVLDDENPWSLAAERGEEISPAIRGQAARELGVLQGLYEIGCAGLLAMVSQVVPELDGLWTPLGDEPTGGSSPRQETARWLAEAGDWGGCVAGLEAYFSGHGAGDLGRFRAFRWQDGGLEPVREPDPVSLSELGGHEEERGPLLRNTERFLEGLPASHVLVYGQPGTGKSSNVKAVLGAYADRGLRAVEVAREDLPELPAVLDALRGRGGRFVVFVDDLSFEAEETGYKALKALLEGSLQAPPANVLLYATSNRRNLIRESFTERDEDVHAQDTAREKLSLAARFGLRVTFLAPDQKKYLRMVENLADVRGLNLPKEELYERALAWERRISARSGRTARQFVDELQANLAADTSGDGDP
ncbi:ATP-binding protein [Rubrobacter aplysinae]|uniref:ATP-binding protein n=1 Tax=Rubrobacter aplysinae TaxID=909625 RepID=UPI00064C487D|nr:ATP-binding protein [Rubrobacter aplysinae]